MMSSEIISEAKIRELKKLISGANKIVLTCHVSPDGDALGSSLALSLILKTLEKDVSVITPDQYPKSLSFLPGAETIIPYSCHPEKVKKIFLDADLIICLDFNALSRIDRQIEAFKMSTAPKVLIDHHLYPELFAQLTFSDATISSTCLLLYKIICSLDYCNYINKDVATCIYTGMMTDTGNFTYNSYDPCIYTTISDLLGKGLPKDEIYKQVYNTNSESRLRLNGYVLNKKMQIHSTYNLGIISLTKEEKEEYNYVKGDTEGLVNIPLSIPGIYYSVFFREDIDADNNKYIKVSMRSIGEYQVNIICERYYNGGGHKNASGGEYYGSIESAIELLLSHFKSNENFK